MMSDEEDFDELPSISVNSSLHESSSFSMPSAEELATQRAREAECESALLRLREEHARADRECALGGGGCGAGAAVSAVVHSDSSGSEGEAGAAAALAAAVCALRVVPLAPAPADVTRPLLQALLRHRPADALLAAYMASPMPHALTHQITASISEMVLEAASSEDVQVWTSEEILSITGWLCVVLGASGGKREAEGHRTLLRTLHLLIEDVATNDQMEAIKDLMLSCAGEGVAALQLCDALWGTGDKRGDTLACALAYKALGHLAGLTQDQEGSLCGDGAGGGGAVWRRLPPARQYLALQLASRLLSRSHAPQGAGCGEAGHEAAGRAVLDALASATPGQRAHTTEQLKVLVAASKLQVLFHVNK